MRRTRSGCCARVASGQKMPQDAAAALLSRVMNARRFMPDAPRIFD
jgi:hypothetical protein